MMPFPKIHDLYIARSILGAVLLTWLVLLGMDFMVGGLVKEMQQVGQGKYTAADAFVTVLYTLPSRAYLLFPTAAVIGSLMGLGQLAASSELTVMRAVGLSRRRISVAVAGTLLVFTALMVVNGETLAPWGTLESNNYKASKKYDNHVLAKQHGLWALEGNTVVSATAGEPRVEGGRRWLELTNMRLYEFESNGRLKSITYAGRAQHEKDMWQMQDTVRIDFAADRVTRTTAPSRSWKSSLDEAALASSIVRADALTAKDLAKNIAYRKRNSLETSEFEDTYWSRWFYPLNVLALCLAAIPFAFGTLRSGGFGKRLFLGIVFALGFWMVQTQSVKLASVFKIDFRLAYLVPLILMLCISWILFKRKPVS